MKNILAAVVVSFSVIGACGPVLGEDGARKPEIDVETHGNMRNITVGGSDGWQAVIAKVQSLRQIPRDQDAEIVATLTEQMDDLPPAFIYELARRLCAKDPDKAEDLFNIAGGRLRYDAARCVDKTAMAGVSATVASLQSPDFQACISEERMIASLRRLKGSPALFASHASPWWICSHGMAAIAAGLEHRELAKSDWLKPEQEWPEARKMIEDGIDYTLAKHSKP